MVHIWQASKKLRGCFLGICEKASVSRCSKTAFSPSAVFSFSSAMEEASFIAQDIQEKVRSGKFEGYNSFAVLYRTNAQSRLLEERFVLGSIPYNVVGGTNFYARREIKDVLAYLKTIDNGSDDIAVRRIINVPKRGIGATTLGRAAEYAAQEDSSLFSVMEKGDQIPGVKKAGLKLRAFRIIYNISKRLQYAVFD